MGSNAQINKQLLIDVMRHADVDRLKEPLCPEPDVRFVPMSPQKINLKMDANISGSHSTPASKQASDRRRTPAATCRGGYPLSRQLFWRTPALNKHRECTDGDWMEWAHQSSDV